MLFYRMDGPLWCFFDFCSVFTVHTGGIHSDERYLELFGGEANELTPPPSEPTYIYF
jgi:hypothetical protein